MSDRSYRVSNPRFNSTHPDTGHDMDPNEDTPLSSRLKSHKWKFIVYLLVWQIIFLVLFAVFVRYGAEADITRNAGDASNPEVATKLASLYPMFQDVHVMMFVGFGFLMIFLKWYGFGSFGYNFLLCSFIIQLSILIGGFIKMIVVEIDGDPSISKIYVDIGTLFAADFTCATILISFGAVLGKVSGFQLLVMATIEVIVFKINEEVGLHYIEAVDVGGSMFVHVFGAYFGLGVSRVLFHKAQQDNPKEKSNYISDMFGFTGCIFLWIYWPSFNSAMADDEEKVRAVINTYISLAACCVVTFAFAALVEKDGKITMEYVQNSTLAGGVAVGTTCNMMIHPAGAMAIGMFAGAVSTLGYRFLKEFLCEKLKIHDTCGVHNLHGIPGVIAGICGIIVAAFASDDDYGDVRRVFPDWSGAGEQALKQGGALLATLGMAIVGGVLTGLLIRFVPTSPLDEEELFNDTNYWHAVDFKED